MQQTKNILEVVVNSFKCLKNFSIVEIISSFILISFAIWTLFVHCIMFIVHGNFHDLVQWSFIVPFVSVATLLFIYQIESPQPKPTPDTTVLSEKKPDWMALAIAISLVAILVTAKPISPNGRFYLFWLLAMLFLAVNWFRIGVITEHATFAPAAILPKERAVFGLTIIASILFIAFLHRENGDDRIYLSMAVWSIENPAKPLLSGNGILWGEGLPLLLSAYKLHTLELMWAFFAYLNNIAPIYVAHIFFPPLFAGWVVLCNSQLLRVLVPKYWLHSLLIFIFLMLALGGETRAGFSMFSFILLQFGKSVVVSATLPLLILFAIRFMESGSRKEWLLLFFGQIAALGLSSTAVFIAPTAVGLTLLACWRRNLLSTKRLMIGVSSSVYLLGMGLFIRSLMLQSYSTFSGGMGVTNNIIKVFGDGPHLYIYLLAAVGAWTLIADTDRRRLFLSLSLFYFALIWNPFLQPFWMEHLTGKMVYWRMFYTIPLPAMAAVLILAPVSAWSRGWLPSPLTLLTVIVVLLGLSRFPQWVGLWSLGLPIAITALVILTIIQINGFFQRVAATLALATLLVALAHFDTDRILRRAPISKSNFVHFHKPGLRVSEKAYSAAKHLVSIAPYDRSTLVDYEIGVWVPTLLKSPLLVGSNGKEQHNMLSNWLDKEERERRTLLLHYITGKNPSPDAGKILADAIKIYQIGSAVSKLSNPQLDEIHKVFLSAGFRFEEKLGYRYWVVQ
ncbi:MAG: hypothetical protein HQL70_08795 [Magnetococcales bacterium]|nr:hypothetical protein [Magnetococcales bacterium]